MPTSPGKAICIHAKNTKDNFRVFIDPLCLRPCLKNKATNPASF
jgi:hypothetical protein